MLEETTVDILGMTTLQQSYQIQLVANSGSNKNFDWHTVATPLPDAGDAMEAAADVVWAALQANTQVRVDKLC